MAYHSLQAELKLPITLDEAWNFFSDPRNLAKITPEKMGFTITNTVDQKMFEGQIITYKVKPIAGIKMNWMTEITTVKQGEYFIDEQRFGPYALWHHKHSFEEIEGGILMKDLINYKLPMGILGSIAHGLFVRKQLEGIFAHRTKVLNERFGIYPD